MNFIKKVTSAVASAIFLSALCCGCTSSGASESIRRSHRNDGRSKDDTAAVLDHMSEDEILIIDGYKNEAWGHYSSLFFVMADGNIYGSTEEFEGISFSGGDGLTYEERATLLRKYSEPVGKISGEELEKIYGYALKIDPDAEFVYEDEYEFDSGTHFVEVLANNGEYLKISESGECTGALKDRYAKKVASLLKSHTTLADRSAPAHVYSATETYIHTFECPGADLKEPRRIITNIDELNRFEKDTGITLQGTEDFEYFGDPDYDKFRWCWIGVEIILYDEYLSLDGVSADAFIVSDDYVGFGLIEEPVIAISDGIVNQKTYCYVVQIPAGQPGVYDAFVD